MKKLFIPLLLILGIRFICFAQPIVPSINRGSIEQKRYMETVHYKLMEGKMIIPVTIDGKIYSFLFDTGAPFSISEKLYKELNPEIIGNEDVTDVSGEINCLKIISIPRLNLNKLTFLNTQGIIFQKKVESICNCLGIDGIIGSNMLRNSVVQIDSRNHQITITNRVKNFELKKKPFQDLHLSPSQSNPFVIVGVENNTRQFFDKILIDTGEDNFYCMSIQSYNFFEKHKLFLDTIAESYGRIYQEFHGSENKEKHIVLRIPKFNLNDTVFENVITTTVMDKNSRMGIKALEYGKMTIDYIDKRFYFELYTDLPSGETTERPWQISPIIQDNQMRIGIIWDQSLNKQICLGDEIISINDIDYQSKSVCDLMKTNGFSDFKGDKLILKLKDVKTGNIKTVEIHRL